MKWSTLSTAKQWLLGVAGAIVAIGTVGGGVWTFLSALPTGGPIHMDVEAQEIVKHHDDEVSQLLRQMEQTNQEEKELFTNWRLQPVLEDIAEIDQQLENETLTPVQRSNLLRKMSRKEKLAECIRSGEC